MTVMEKMLVPAGMQRIVEQGYDARSVPVYRAEKLGFPSWIGCCDARDVPYRTQRQARLDGGAVMRASGQYAVVDGQQFAVIGRGRHEVTLDLGTGPRDYAITELDDLLKVSKTATWRGATIYVAAVDAELAGFYTHSMELAKAEGLSGEQYSGWTGRAPLAELSGVLEKVVSIHPRERER